MFCFCYFGRGGGGGGYDCMRGKGKRGKKGEGGLKKKLD